MTLWDRIKAVLSFIRKMDLVLIIMVMSLLSISVFALYHIGVEEGDKLRNKWFLQMGWIFVGFVLMVIIAYIDYGWIGANSWAFYLFGIFLLVLVLLIGKTLNNAQSWIGIGPFTIQPSEIAKPCTIVALAWYASRPRVLLHQFTNIIPVIILAAIPILLIGKQPDFGSALVFIPITATVLFVAGCKIRYLAYPILMAVVLTPVVYFSLSSHQMDRIDVWLHPYVHPKAVSMATGKAQEAGLPEDKIARIKNWRNPLDYTNLEIDYFKKKISKEEYRKELNKCESIRYFLANDALQAHQSALAVSSGGIAGKGWGNGTQLKLGFLPKDITPTDCIFSIICEEGGFFWALIILLLILGIILCSIRTACLARDLYGKVLSISIGMLFLCHTYVNVGMAIGAAPIIGIPLPFMSYGGSFIVSAMACIGILQSVYIRREVTASEHRLSDLF